MKTYRGGTGWTESTWPANPGTADETTWDYEEATGLLTRTTYADESHVDYAYNSAGKLCTRTWARGIGNPPTGLTTTYTYDAHTGELTGIDYTDSTSDVTFTYTRIGLQETITDIVGIRTFEYNDELQVETETIDGSGGGLYSRIITRKIETGQEQPIAGVPGRAAGFQIGVTGDLDRDHDVTYAYEPKDTSTGRLLRIDGPGLPDYGVEYTRLANSDLVEYVRFKSASDTSLVTMRRAYESDRDLLDYVSNVVNGSPDTEVSRYEYGLDTLGRRTSVVHTGTAFADNHLLTWDYNDRDELTAANRFLGTHPEQPGSGMTPGDYDYGYDLIGNRTTYRLDSDPATTYTTNSLNQYTATGNPAASFGYDDDGNLISDGAFSYAWDGENRLVSIAPASPSPGGVKLVFDHDYMSRRVRKRAYAWDDGQEEWGTSPTADLKFVYDGWNEVLVLDGNNGDNVKVKYTWGLDSSATLYGDGGISGLLAAYETQGTSGMADDKEYWYTYDGNGNVVQVFDGADQSIAARYEYDPFGIEIDPDRSPADPYDDDNPYRFSTKWLDTELAGIACNSAIGNTGLYYYGYRYYSPALGRWLGRDPIWELGWFESIAWQHVEVLLRGYSHGDADLEVIHRLRELMAEFKKPGPLQHRYGLSLYAFSGNSPINITDALGGCDNGSPPPDPEPEPKPKPEPEPKPKPEPDPPSIPMPGPGDIPGVIRDTGPYCVPDDGIGTIGSALGCAPDITRAYFCKKYQEALICLDGDEEACEQDPDCKKWKDACEKAK